MSKHIEWDMQQHPDFFKSSPSGKYTDLSIVRHVVSNVNPPDGEVDEAFMKILNAVAEEVDLIPALDDVVKVVRCGECRHSTLPSATTQAYGAPGTLTCHHGPCNRRNVNENDFCSYGERREK